LTFVEIDSKLTLKLRKKIVAQFGEIVTRFGSSFGDFVSTFIVSQKEEIMAQFSG